MELCSLRQAVPKRIPVWDQPGRRIPYRSALPIVDDLQEIESSAKQKRVPWSLRDHPQSLGGRYDG